MPSRPAARLPFHAILATRRLSARGRRAAGVVAVVLAVLVLALVATAAVDGEQEPVAGPATTTGTEFIDGATTTAVDDVAPSGAVTPTVKPTDRVAPNGRDLGAISEETDFGLPVAAKRAYLRAARRANTEHPGCDLPWELVAGIGRVESDHGRFGGSRLGVDGVSRPRIIGIALNGVGPVAAIPDTDDGRLDGDPVWDRAIGPMQFIPTTWRAARRDGDGDAVTNPHDLDDAALATASLLCPASGTILEESVMRAAVFAYNHSEYYVDLVIAFAIGYHTGVFDLPPPPVEEPQPTESSTSEPTREPKPTRTPRPTSAPPAPGPTPGPTPKPTPEPTPKPTPTTQPPSPTPTQPPQPPPFAQGSGAWSACEGTWCLEGRALDLGPADRYDVEAAEDFDGDGTVETNRAEFDGLAGRRVTIAVRRGTNVVYLIDGRGFRNADGSFST